MTNEPKHLLADFSDSGTASETYLEGLPLKRHMQRSEILRVFTQIQNIPKLSRVGLLRLEKAAQDLRAYWNNSPELHAPYKTCLQKVINEIPKLLDEDSGACFAAQDLMTAIAKLADSDEGMKDFSKTCCLQEMECIIASVKDEHCRKIQHAIKARKREQRKKKEAARNFCERLLKRHPSPLQDLIIDANVVAAQIQASLYNPTKSAVFIEIDGILASFRGLCRMEVNPEAEEFIQELSLAHEVWLFNFEHCSYTKLLAALDPTSSIVTLQKVLIGITESQLVQQVRQTSASIKTLVVSYRLVRGLEAFLVPVLPFIHDSKINAYASMLRVCSGLTPLQAAVKDIRDRSKEAH
mmetsp:Transcript_18712/g.33902  ORF Transcript_18712/g.33902 Transcript_18712/m.33902 type:complete len:353 (+) Transcript_18712:282-1340(+)